MALAASALALTAGGVSAAPITVEFNGIVKGSNNMTITKAPVLPAYSSPTAGGFSMTGINPAIGDFIAWCLDLATSIHGTNPLTYVVTDTPVSGGFNVYKDQVATLFRNSNYSDSVTDKNSTSAGFQLALWEVAYDTPDADGNFSLGTGAFQATAGSAILREANAFLAYMTTPHHDAGGGPAVTFLQNIDNPLRQSLVTASPIPLPAAAWLLIGGIGMLAAARRRRREAAA